MTYTLKRQGDALWLTFLMFSLFQCFSPLHFTFSIFSPFPCQIPEGHGIFNQVPWGWNKYRLRARSRFLYAAFVWMCTVPLYPRDGKSKKSYKGLASWHQWQQKVSITTPYPPQHMHNMCTESESADLYSLDAQIGLNRRSQFAIYLFFSLCSDHKSHRK